MPVHPVIHPGGSTDNAIVRHDGETGKRLQNGQSTEDDSGNVAIVGTLSVGTGHTVSGTLASVAGGSTNTNAADYGFLGGGQNCSIASGSDHSVLAIQITGNGGQNVAVGGYTNTISATGQFNFIGSGWGNDITINAYNAVLVGGKDNDNAASYAFIGGGELCSIASGADHSVVVGGYNNDITGTGDDNFIGGGNGCGIGGTALSAVVVGGLNTDADANYSFAGGGQNCSIAAGADHSVISATIMTQGMTTLLVVET
jgi:hypothetical protein